MKINAAKNKDFSELQRLYTESNHEDHDEEGMEEQAPIDPGMPGTGQPGTLPPDASESPLGQYAAILQQVQSGTLQEPDALAQLQALSQDASALEGQPQSPQPVGAGPLEEEDEDDKDETVDEEIDPSVALGGPTGHLSQNVSLPSFGS